MQPFYDKDGITIYNGNCFDVFDYLKNNNFKTDLVLTDPPYGTTACEWDKIPDLDKLWVDLKLLSNKQTVFVFTATQPFTSKLIMSNLKWFKYEWIWDRIRGTGFQICNVRPLIQHENIVVFCDGKAKYNPQKVEKDKPVKGGKVGKKQEAIPTPKYENRIITHSFPKSILSYSKDTGLHPTQKPLEMMEYLIRTYTDEWQLVFDPFMGSGTTLLAAKKQKRRAVGIEMNLEYCEIAKKRLEECS